MTKDAANIDLTSLLKETSQCQVPELARPCFPTTTVLFNAYVDKFCNNIDGVDVEGDDGNFPPCVLIDQVRLFPDLIRPNTYLSLNGIIR